MTTTADATRLLKAKLLAERDKLLREAEAVSNQIIGIERAIAIWGELPDEEDDAALALSPEKR